MSQKQIILAGAGAAVVVGLAILYFATRETSQSRSAAAPAVTPAVDRPVAGSTPSERRRAEIADSGDPVAPTKPERHDYIDDNGRMVRDHRRGNPEPLLDSKTDPRDQPRKVGPEVIMTISRALRPIFRSCIGELDDDQFGQFGPNAQVQAKLLVTIAEDVISVDDVEVQLSEGDEADLLGCIRDAAGALSLPAQGEPEISEQWLTFPHRLRR